METETIKTYLLTICIGVLFIAFIYFSSNTSGTQYRTEKVRIDSISIESKNFFLPEKTWFYYTKYGTTITANNEIYNVGDSIEVKIVKVKR